MKSKRVLFGVFGYVLCAISGIMLSGFIRDNHVIVNSSNLLTIVGIVVAMYVAGIFLGKAF